MSNNNRNYNHPPIRVPQRFEEIRQMVIQIESLMDNIYKKIGDIDQRLKTLEEEE